MLQPGHTFKNYKEFAEYFNFVPQTNTKARRKQEEYVSNFIVFTRAGHKYIIHQTKAPYKPLPKVESPFMEITEQLIHEMLLHAKGFYKKSKYGTVDTLILTFVDGFELVGLARPGWTRLRNDDKPETADQRRAYFTHYSLCKDRWASVVKSLVKRNVLVRDTVYVLIEQVKTQDGVVEVKRLAETNEEPDCEKAMGYAFGDIVKRYPELEIKTFAELYYNFKEKEYNKIRLQYFQKYVDKWTINANRPPYKVVDFFKASRFAFTQESLAQYTNTTNTPEEIQRLKEQVAIKLHQWYHLPKNEDKLSSVRPFLFSLLDLVGA